MLDNTIVHYRKDYSSPTHLIDKTDITFDIFTEHTKVISRLLIKKNPAADINDGLFLHGAAKLISLCLDGKQITEKEYSIQTDGLLIHKVPDDFILEITTELTPQTNTSLMGLYASNGNLFTQCEPEGFRQITYYIDRPDVMSRFSTTIIADKNDYPVLLSNGNKTSEGTSEKNRHWVKWVDPYRKPSYLFALVAGKLVSNNDSFIRKSGRKVDLQIWTDPADKQRTFHAMQSIKHAMKWDEERFNLEYDLDIFMIVAVSDFNMGAMENKGLNIFNTQYVLANEETATDDNFSAIESVIGHEYFHNWTGNRVTCRDWFQLSLKEGLTVFRDQEFSADLHDESVQRIEDVKRLRALQFPEDAGPTAHPIRPESYIEMNNFYTATVYEKGAEIIRMYQTLLGKEGFAAGLALYFKRHDGQAVTCDDFLRAMSDANQTDLTQFSLWYQQSGTPSIKVNSQYNQDKQEFTIDFEQFPSKNSSIQDALHIPIKMGLLDKNGINIALQLKHSEGHLSNNGVLNLRKKHESFTFVNVADKPTPSLLREFSAPVYLEYSYSNDQLEFLMMNDSDAFARWQAGQTLIQKEICQIYVLAKNEQPLVLAKNLLKVFEVVLLDKKIEPKFKALMLTLPSENEILEWLDDVDPILVCRIKTFIEKELAIKLKNIWEQTFNSLNTYKKNNAEQRALKNLALYMLNQTNDESAINTAFEQFNNSDNMTEQLGALLALNNKNSKQRNDALSKFNQRWQSDMLVMDKYFSLIAQSPLPGCLDRVKEAMNHPNFNLKNPNKVRALIGTFSKNMSAFHAEDGSGYKFIAQCVKQIDKLNPQLASRIVQAFNRWHKLEKTRAEFILKELNDLLNMPNLSKDVGEIVSKALF